MKMLFAVAGLVLFALSCGGGSSSSGSGEYILQPGSLTTTTMNESYNITFNSSLMNVNPGYAIIYRGTVGGNSYIGISIDSDGNPSNNLGFNMKLYFYTSSLPSGPVTLSENGSEALKIAINNDGTPYTPVAASDSIKLNFSAVDSNNIVTITGADGDNNTIVVGGVTLEIDEIKAYYYNTAQ